MDINYLKPLLEQKALENGYELVSINTRKEKDDLILALVVDRVKPIDMEAITEISNVLSNYLDELDMGEESYFLDISSLGAEKPLKVESLDKYVNSYVNVHITNPIEGENIFEGELEEVSEENIVISYHIKTRVKKVTIAKGNIYKIRLAIKF